MIAVAYLGIVGVEHLCERLAVVEEHVLPLAHIAKVVVVHKYNLNRSLLFHNGAKLLYAHLETAVAGKEAYGAVGRTERCANGSWQSEAHCAESTTRYDAKLALELEVAAREHLVLTNVINQHSLALCSLCHSVYYLAHKQRSFLRMDGWLYHLLRFLLEIWLEALNPLLVLVLVKQTGYGRQRHLTVANNRHVGLDILVNLHIIYIEMYNLGLLGVCVKTSGNTVAEAHTDSYYHIGLLCKDVGCIAAVHTEHTHIERMVGRKGRESEQCACRRDVCLLKKLDKLVVCSTKFYTMTNERQWTLCLVYQLGSSCHMVVMYLWIRVVAANRRYLCRLPIACTNLSTLREINNHWTRTACTCYVEGTAYSPSHVLRTAYLIAPLADRLSQTHEVDLLESIGAESAYAHLSGNDNDWGRIDHGICHTRKRVGNTRAACNQAHSYLAANTRETFGGMGSRLFVTYENVVESLVLASCIIV